MAAEKNLNRATTGHRVSRRTPDQPAPARGTLRSLAARVRWLGCAGAASLKTRWFARPSRSARRMPIAYDTLDAVSLARDERAALGTLIVSSFPKAELSYGGGTCREWRQRAWRTVQAEFHVVARACDGTIVGQQSVYRLEVSSGRLVYGLGDLVVVPSCRRRGIGRTLIAGAVAEAQGRGADALCTRTGKLAGTFARLGFELDTDGRRFTDGRGAPLEFLWVWLADGTRTDAEPLAPSDF
jgi:predicted N-acetyltransferase YhbS